jgi:ribosome-associated protein
LVASQAQLRYDTTQLEEEIRRRLVSLARKQITEEGILIIQARRYRTQEQNRQDALQRLVALLQKAAVPPKPRKKTHPSFAARQERLADKRHKSQVKRLRRDLDNDE